jgi:hypothetical protein
MFHIDFSNNGVIERTWLVIFSNVREISKLPRYVGRCSGAMYRACTRRNAIHYRKLVKERG